MFLILSFVMASVSLYYLGVMANSYDADTTYLAPIVASLIFSVLSIFRSMKDSLSSWLDDDYYCYDSYYNKANTYNVSYGYSSNENVEYFSQSVKDKTNEDESFFHYSSKEEIRNKIKELEKSRWFRFKKSFASIFGVDITEKYKKPYKINSRAKVVNASASKENHSRWMPNNNWLLEREKEEYNAVTKLMGRSCEIALSDIESNLKDENNERK